MSQYSVEAVLSVQDKNFSSTMSNVSKSLENVGGNAKKSKTSIMDIAKGIGVFKAVDSAIGMVKNSIGGAIKRFDTLGNYPKVMDKLGFSADQSKESINKLSDGIQGLPTALDEIASSTQNIALLTNDLGLATDTSIALNDALLASGSSGAEASRGTQQYVKMLSQGKVNMESWMTLQETMGLGLRDVAKAFGYTGKSATNDLYKALQEGDVTFDQFNKKLIELDGGVNGFSEKAKTASGGIGTSWANLKTAIVRETTSIITKIDEGLYAFGGFEGIINNVKQAFSFVLQHIGNLVTHGLNILVPAILWTGKNIDKIIPVVVTFMGLWATNKMLTFVRESKGLVNALKSIRIETIANTAAKIKETASMTASNVAYVKDAIVTATSTVKKGLLLVATKTLTAAETLNTKALLAGTGATAANTTAVALQTAALKIGSIAAKAFGVAIKFFTGPLGIAIVGVTALVGIVGALSGAFSKNKKESEATAKKQKYLNGVFAETRAKAENVETVYSRIADETLPKLKDSWDTLQSSLSKYSLTHNADAIKDLTGNTKEYVNTVKESVTQYYDEVYKGAVDYYSKYGDLSEEEEKEILKSLAKYHDEQKKEMEEHASELLRLGDLREKKGELNAEEQDQYQKHLEALNIIAIETITPEQARQLGEQKLFLARKGELQEEEQDKFAESLRGSLEEERNTLTTEYGIQLANLDRKHADEIAKCEKQGEDTTNVIKRHKKEEKDLTDSINSQIEASENEHFIKLLEGVTGYTNDEIKEYFRLQGQRTKIQAEINTTAEGGRKTELENLRTHLDKKIKDMGISDDKIKEMTALTQKEENEGFKAFWKAQVYETRNNTQEIEGIMSEHADSFSAFGATMAIGLAGEIGSNAWRIKRAAEKAGADARSAFDAGFFGAAITAGTAAKIISDARSINRASGSSRMMPTGIATYAEVYASGAEEIPQLYNSNVSRASSFDNLMPIAGIVSNLNAQLTNNRMNNLQPSRSVSQDRNLIQGIKEAINDVEIRVITALDGKVLADQTTSRVDRNMGSRALLKERGV